MRFSITTWLFGLVTGLTSSLAAAVDLPNDRRVADEAELSYVETGGNSEVKTLSARNQLVFRLNEAWTGSWKLAALRGETSGALTAERYLTEMRADYRFTERTYGFATAGWQKDPFAGVESDAYVGPGAGYKFLTGPRHLLIGELGALYDHEYYVDGTESSRVDGRGFGSYTFAFSERNKFIQTIEFLYDFDESENYRINSETALRTALNSFFSIKVSYIVRHDHQPVPSTLEQTDTTLSVALIATF